MALLISGTPLEYFLSYAAQVLPAEYTRLCNWINTTIGPCQSFMFAFRCDPINNYETFSPPREMRIEVSYTQRDFEQISKDLKKKIHHMRFTYEKEINNLQNHIKKIEKENSDLKSNISDLKRTVFNIDELTQD